VGFLFIYLFIYFLLLFEIINPFYLNIALLFLL